MMDAAEMQEIENVQAIVSVTRTDDQILSMGMMAGQTTAVTDKFTSGLFAIDIAL